MSVRDFALTDFRPAEAELDVSIGIRVMARRLLAAGSLSANLLLEDSSLAENGLQRVRQGLMTLLPMQDLGHGNGLAALGGDVAIPNLSFMRPDFFSDPLFFLPQEIEPISPDPPSVVQMQLSMLVYTEAIGPYSLSKSKRPAKNKTGKRLFANGELQRGVTSI